MINLNLKQQAANATQLLEYFTKTSELEQNAKNLQNELNSSKKTIKLLNGKIEELEYALSQKNNDLKVFPIFFLNITFRC